MADTAISGFLDGDSVEEIVIDSLISGATGAIAGSGGSDFVKGGKLLNDAAGSVGKVIRKGVNPVVKKTAKKTLRKARKFIGRRYVGSQLESLAYMCVDDFSSKYINAVIQNY